MANRLFPARDYAEAASRRAQALPTPRSVAASGVQAVPLALLSFFSDTELAEMRNLLVSAGDLSNETADLIERQRRVNTRISEIVAAVKARNPQITSGDPS